MRTHGRPACRWEDNSKIDLYILKPSFYCVRHQNLYILPTQYIYIFGMDLTTNSNYFLLQLELIGFYNGEGRCLLRGAA